MSIIYKSLIFGGEISLAVLDTTELVNEAIRRHGLSPVAAAALGRTLTATAYLCSWLKEDESSLSVTVNGGGAGGKILAVGDGALNLRGFIENAQVDLPPRADGKLDVGTCVGKTGVITVIRDDGTGIPFVGTSELVSGELAEDFSYYFLTSEQRPTAIALGVKIGTDGTCLGAGGVFLQPMPFASEEAISYAEAEIAKYGAVSSVIERDGAEAILRAFGAENVEKRTASFSCRCSRTKAESAVLAMGEAEAHAVLKEEGKLSVHCHYCNTDYNFTEIELAELFRGGDGK